MAYLPWQDEYSVGVKEFDEQHKILFGIINELGDALDGGEDRESVREIMKHLLRYTRVHFRDEELNQIFYDYPEYKKHKDEHERLTNEVVEYALDLSAKPELAPKMMSFLQNWILKHILVNDVKYTKFFEGKDIMEWE